MSFTDADLVARVLSREDQNAFGELVRRYQSPVRGFLLRMTGDLHLSDDLAQETFLKAWQKLHTYRGGAKISTWLFSIALNEFRTVLRRRKELTALDEADEPAKQDGVSEGMRLDLTEAMKRLNSNERAAVLLCCQNGLSHEEAAEALGCPLGTVKTNVLRGREKLKKYLWMYKDYESAGRQ